MRLREGLKWHPFLSLRGCLRQKGVVQKLNRKDITESPAEGHAQQNKIKQKHKTHNYETTQGF